MEPPLLFVVFALVAGAVAWWQYARKQRRRSEIVAFASKAGLAYGHDDPFGTVRLGFDLFREGDGRGVENVCWGETGGLEVRLFDYWYYEERRDSEGHRSRSYSYFTCALSRLPGVYVPRLSIEPESLTTRVSSLVSGRDLQFESEDFNRRFHVRGRQGRFAYALLDARMIDWMLKVVDGYRFEVSGDLVLVSSRRLPSAQLWELLTVTRGFRDRLPEVVASLYPAPDEAPPPLSDWTSMLAASQVDREDGGIVPKWTLGGPSDDDDDGTVPRWSL